MQLNNVLGRPNYAPPLIHDGDTNTHRGLNTRYDYLSDIMDEREREIPTLNQNPSASINHSTFISSQFLRASIQDGQEGQVVQAEADAERVDQGQIEIDLSDSQIDQIGLALVSPFNIGFNISFSLDYLSLLSILD